MRTRNLTDGDDRRDIAVGWLVKIQSDAVTADEWADLTRWLDESPANLAAFEAAEHIDDEITASASTILAALPAATAEILPFRRRTAPAPARRDHRWAVAAGVAAVSIAVGVLGWRASEGPQTVYVAGPGAPRAVTLADGTRVRLDANSKLSVRMGWFSRQATLDQAVASFDVTKDPNRPFEIAAADQRVHVVGTEFVVRDYGGVVDVSVRRGVVTVSPLAGGPPEARLTSGWSLQHVVNSRRFETRRVDPDAAFDWTQGRLVCDRKPVGEIVGYLNHRFATPIRLASGAAADEAFSGVLDLGGQEDDVVRRLAAYLSLTVHRSAAEIVLS